MTCDDAQLLISARIDGETADADRTALDAHLGDCAACAAAFEEMLEDDAVARAAFADRRAGAEAVADAVIARLGLAEAAAAGRTGPVEIREAASQAAAMTSAGETSPAMRVARVYDGSDARRRRAPIARRLTPLLAAAAGFALAVVLMRPWDRPGVGGPVVDGATRPTNPATTRATATVAAEPVARLALATGQVDVCPPGGASFFACPTGGPIEPGTRVRTGAHVRAELRMADGSEVRLNDRTEVTVRGARAVTVSAGQVFSVVARPTSGDEAARTAWARANPFVVDAAPAGARLIALGTEFDIACAPLGEAGGAAAPAAGSTATLTVVEGAVSVDDDDAPGQARAPARVVRAGEAVTLAGGAAGDVRRVGSLAIATQWVDEILVLKGRDNPELARRLDDLLAQLGQHKMSYLAAQEVKRLGDHCVRPLVRYIESDKSRGPEQASRRREAARIVADVATTSSVPELINLLADADGEVRFHAARALERITGQTQGRPADQWRDQAWMSCVPSVERWHAWWGQNRTKLPGCDPQGVRPIEVVKQAPLVPKG